MEMSVREARAQFAHALAAAERGERVVITKHGKPVAQLVPPETPAPPKQSPEDFWAHQEIVRRELGLDKYDGPPLDEAWLEDFNNAAGNRRLFRLDDDGDELLK